MSRQQDAERRLVEILKSDFGFMADVYVTAIREAIAADPSLMEAFGEQWRPIETAPKDGSEVLVWVSEAYGLPAFMTHCAWHPSAGWCADELRPVTHWMPLQPPPTQQGENNG